MLWIMAESSTLQLLDEHGWRRSFMNMLRRENGEWWRTRRWLVRSLVWTVIMNGIVFIMLWVVPAIEGQVPSTSDLVEVSLQIYFAFLVFAAPIGVMVFAQGAIVSEKESGTAAWIMSKPVSRSAFILSKLVANAFGSLVIIVMLQSLIFYLQVLLKGGEVPLLPLLAGLGLAYLHMLFYLTLVLMLGTFFSSRAPVIGIGLALLVGQLIIGDIIATLISWFPLVEPRTVGDVATAIAVEIPLPDNWFVPVILTALACVLFTALAIWRFNQEDF